MSRRSTRIASKPTPKFQNEDDEISLNADVEFDHDDVSDFDEEAEQPARKKRKQTFGAQPKQFKARRGKLRQLPEMPIDILYEIFGHVRPHDLLRLSRTTKALRGILMRRSAVSVWKDVMGQVEGLPECPSDLAEPQYASLAFDSYCHLCEAPNVHTIFWECRMRCCQKCINSRFLDLNGIAGSFPLIYSRNHFTMLPSGSAKFGRYYTRKLYNRSDVTAVHGMLKELEHDIEKRDAYVQEKEAEVTALRKHAGICELWQRDAISGRSVELDGMRNRRKDAITEKLRGLGYGLELDQEKWHLSALSKHQPMNKPQELTERIWTNISQPIIEIMDAIRQQRLQRIHRNALQARLKIVADLLREYAAEQPIHAVIPGLGDICNMVEFRSLIIDPEDDVDVPKDDFEGAMIQLPVLITAWRMEKEAELVSLMLNPNPDIPSATSSDPDFNRKQLELAKAQFQCKFCKQAISYPRVLVHACITEYRPSQRAADSDDEKIMWSWQNKTPWDHSTKIITFGGQIQSSITQLLTSCELDPDNTTAQQMDDSDFRFECLGCRSNDAGASIMSWRSAVRHSELVNGDTHKWKLVDEVDTARAKEKQKERSSTQPEHSGIFCRHCRSNVWGYRFEAHMKNEHNIDPTTEADWYKSLDSPHPFDRIYMLSIELEEEKAAKVKEQEEERAKAVEEYRAQQLIEATAAAGASGSD